MAKGRKTGGRTAGTPNKATAGINALLREMLPGDRLKKEWNKWLRHSDPRIAFKAFKLANAYLFGKPAMPTIGSEDAPPIHIDISAIPRRREPANLETARKPRACSALQFHYAHIVGDAERVASEKFSQRIGQNITQLESDSELESTSSAKTA